jgi:peptide/nickel transport system substrate-binding protein/oligopeptide transport system substrate-binding protein
LKFDSNLNIVPALAQNWQVSNDGMVYTFNLRKTARFHHGRAVTSQDVIYSLTRLLDPKQNSGDAHLYTRIRGAADFRAGRNSSVSGLRALSDSIVQITMEQPYSPLLRALAQQSSSIVPKEKVETANSDFGKHPVGSGPFRLDQWDEAGQILLSANPEYDAGRPYLDQIRITALPALNAGEAFQLFLEGSLDLSFVPADQVPAARRQKDWVFISRPILRLMYLGINIRDRLFRDRSLRQAVISAVDKSDLLGSDVDYSITHGLIPFSLPGSSHSHNNDPFDLPSARRALQKRRGTNRRPVRVQLWHAHVSENRDRLLSHLAHQLNAAGFEVKIKLLPSIGELLKAIYAGRTQLFLLGEQMDFPDPDALLSRLFHSQSPANPFGYSNPKVDALLLQAQTAFDETVRAGLYGEIEKMILDDQPVLPLALVKYSIVVHRRVRGLELTPLGFQYLPLKDVWLQPNE